MTNGIYIHKETGNQYLVTGTINNAIDGSLMVLYETSKGAKHCQPIPEFKEKFKPLSILD